VTVEYIDSKTHKPVFRDRDLKILPPVGALVRFPNDALWEVKAHVFDYHMNPELWICVIVAPHKAK